MKKPQEETFERAVKFNVTFSLTPKQIRDLSVHLAVRRVFVNSEMDTVQIEDRVCMAVLIDASMALAKMEGQL